MPTALSLSLLLAARLCDMPKAHRIFICSCCGWHWPCRWQGQREREKERDNNNNGCAAQQADINQDFRRPEPQMFLKGFTAATTTSGGRLGSLSPGIADNLMHA